MSDGAMTVIQNLLLQIAADPESVVRDRVAQWKNGYTERTVDMTGTAEFLRKLADTVDKDPKSFVSLHVIAFTAEMNLDLPLVRYASAGDPVAMAVSLQGAMSDSLIAIQNIIDPAYNQKGMH